MLPVAMTAKRNLVAALTAAAIAAVPAAPALALNDKEKGFVAGVATAVIVDELLKINRKARLYDRGHSAAPAPVYVQPAPVYVQPAPVYVQPATSIHSTPAALAFNRYSLAERKAIQRNLRAWGYYTGGIDGAFGPRTYNAILAYARDEGLSNRLSATNTAFAVYDSLIF
ncbi:MULTISPECIES: peptidoglycan-binding protein [Tabrizicola]|uniref:peptidoglycan-binding protein n=1 Tax=Tabrizicola TaxID=1443919 RepID=UPI001080B5F8|nr:MULTISPECIES: peptidoglycan-binding protein [Paracoccaceae]